MTDQEIRATVLRSIGSVAPEADLASVHPDRSLRDQLDLDSMDVLNVMTAIHDALGVDVPEADYGKLDTLTHTVAYLSAALARR